MSETTKGKSPLNILVVEDDKLLNQVMCLHVKASGYPQVRSAQRGQQALKMIKEVVPSVLILDLGLPDMKGQELIEELRLDPSTSSIPLIINTSSDLSDEERTKLQLGPTKIISKSAAFSESLPGFINEVTDSSKVL